MKVLITGIAGFVGSNLARRLQAEGHELFGFDNFSTGKRENLAGLNVRMVESVFDVAKPEVIFHLGLPSSTPIYRNDRQKVTEAIKVSIDVFELAKITKSHIVYASSSSIYNGNEAPYKEGMPVHITDYYTEARYLVERLAKLYSEFYGVTSVGTRFFSIYGRGERGKGPYANIITQFMDLIKAGKSPEIYGDGSQTRDFTYVDDVVDALILASKHKKTDVFNVGTGASHSFNDVIDILNKILAKNVRATYKANPLQNYVGKTLADTSKAEKVLGFRAKYSFDEGIMHYMAHDGGVEATVLDACPGPVVNVI